MAVIAIADPSFLFFGFLIGRIFSGSMRKIRLHLGGNISRTSRLHKLQREFGVVRDQFRRVIENQGGDPRVVDDYARMPSVSESQTVTAPRDGFVSELQAENIGRAAVALGAGRAKLDDRVDPAVGIEVERPVGSPVRHGDVILVVRHRAGRGLAEAMPLLTASIKVDDVAPAARPVVVEEVV